MSGDYGWCRDVRRDEAVRAAEDAAAVPSIQHRDLPEQVALLWASLGDIIGRVVRLEGEMDAGQDEEAAPAVCDPASPVEGLRTERVTLEIVYDAQFWHDPSTWAWSAVLKGRTKTVRVVEQTEAMKCMTKLRRERDAARAVREGLYAERDAARAEAERLRARVAELERAYSAECDARAQAHRELGDLNDAIRARESGEERDGSYAAQCREAAAARDCADRMIPAPAVGCEAKQEPRGWLTAEERALIEYLRATFEQNADAWRPRGLGGHVDNQERRVRLLDALLARSSPPRVRRPKWHFHHDEDDAELNQNSRDKEWIAAIREAGGEVDG